MGVAIDLLLFAILAFSFASGGTNEICDLDKESGNCGSYLHRYYFDKDTRKCERFVYTGCGGNENNFGYLYECERTCPGDLDIGDVCSLGPEPGIPGTNIACRAYFPRYYYNEALGVCDIFIFGGCGGNYNNFRTKEECETFCPPASQPPFDPEECFQPQETGNCRAHMQRFYYDKDTEECKEFTYGGCGGSRNNFKTEEECVEKCGDADDLDPSEICSLNKEPGIPGTNIACMAYIPRFYFNSATGKCEKFIFGGCGGNRNQFRTIEECEKFCGVDPSEICSLKKEPGIPGTNIVCTAYIPRFYFESATGKCEKFIFGGCGGNRNQFRTIEECENFCALGVNH